MFPGFHHSFRIVLSVLLWLGLDEMNDVSPESDLSPVKKLPQFSATALIDLKGLVGTINEAKGEALPPEVRDGSGENLLDIFADEAGKLRKSKAKPYLIMPILLQKNGCWNERALGKAALKASEIAVSYTHLTLPTKA